MGKGPEHRGYYWEYVMIAQEAKDSFPCLDKREMTKWHNLYALRFRKIQFNNMYFHYKCCQASPLMFKTAIDRLQLTLWAFQWGLHTP